ncbi:Bax inhibitor-1 family protein, partial [Salmonella enterica]|uniref:Bax inhibitor-1 family protein n=1 Tax=Salmonella enterica TaxID=28901 RepID=UPI0020C2233E
SIKTLLLVGGLTFSAFSIKKYFSFLRSFMTMAGFIAFGAIFASVICGFSVGVWFSALMVLLCAGFIIFDSSNIIHHYP